MTLKGKIKVDRKTKNLVKRIQPYEIAIIDHADLDEVAALSLIKARVKAVINAKPSITGKYPNLGPLALLNHNIPLIDNVGSHILSLQDDEIVEIEQNRIFVNGELYAIGVRQTKETITRMMELSRTNIDHVLEKFVDNTLEYARMEQDLILKNLIVPCSLKTKFKNRHTLIVIRGKTYREDLLAIKSYIDEVRPVLVGVDGGADALIECGYKPDLIIGDMDSISDATLNCGAEIIVHAYPNGRAPGYERIKKMNLPATILPAPGTSEDAAMLLAYEAGTELIVAVGTHSNMIDFLEKGRRGMASTLLTRMKVGSVLVDAKGVSKLYGKSVGFRHVLQVVAASFIPFLIIASVSTALSQYGRLLLLKFRFLLGI
ncbi:MAG: thiamine pyrophosphokinase catalytic subunit [Peptococcaceae bacterium]|jgi:uncharacterized membrane-anchored protein|nr:thiamine pyrophosphokinase catalytic subunit [Peptococcaceae bacterium]